jgi:hypothetical protein
MHFDRNICYTWTEVSDVHGLKYVLHLDRYICRTWTERSALLGPKYLLNLDWTEISDALGPVMGLHGLFRG